MPKLKDEIARLKSELHKKDQELEVMSKRIEELSITDPLTGLFNRNYLHLQIPQIIARAKRNKTSICVAICAINGINVNGDTAGQQHIQHLAHCLQTETREGQDTAYYLEDRFLVVMEQSDEHSGSALLERTQYRFSQKSLGATLTIGLASISWKNLGSCLDEILNLAAANMERNLCH